MRSQVTIVLTIDHEPNVDIVGATEAAIAWLGPAANGQLPTGNTVTNAEIGTVMYDAPVAVAGGGAP